MSPQGDGDVLIIQIDSKATPTATEEELSKRRGKRVANSPTCCQRHRGRGRRKGLGSKKRRKTLKNTPRIGAANQHKLIWTSSQRGEARNPLEDA